MTAFLRQLAQLPSTIGRTLTDPTANLTATAVLLAAIVLAALIGVLVLLVIAIRPSTRRRSEASATRPVAESSRRRRLSPAERGLVASGIAATVLVLGTALFMQADNTATCLRCHAATSRAVVSANAGVHAKQRCWDCHGGRGVFGSVSARLQYARWITPKRSGEVARRADVADGNCLVCHRDVLSRVVKTDHVRMRHADTDAAGWRCTRCHRDAGHEGSAALRERRTFMMSECVVCHDGKTAKAECETCHIDDVGAPGGTPPDRFPKVEMGKPTTCRGCHSIESCNTCHGLEMPHSEAFKKRGHAMEAAFSRKQKCVKCHSFERFCNRCHNFQKGGTGMHPSDFAVSHRVIPLGASCGCHRITLAKDYCILCHGTTKVR